MGWGEEEEITDEVRSKFDEIAKAVEKMLLEMEQWNRVDTRRRKPGKKAGDPLRIPFRNVEAALSVLKADAGAAAKAKEELKRPSEERTPDL